MACAAIYTRINDPTNSAIPLYLRNISNDPTGFALAQSNGLLLSFGSDSGKMKYPQSQFKKQSTAAAINGTRGPKFPSSPPIIGPTIKPTPNAAPIIPKFFALFSLVLISAMYAVAVVKLAPVIPAITLPTKNHPMLGAK